MTLTSRPERKKSSAKTEAILDGAMQEFLANGFAATSMDRVAAAAGVSKATVYSHFHDKMGLFTALIQRLAEEKFSAVFDPHDPDCLKGEPRQVLCRVANGMFDQINRNPQTCEFMRVIVGESGRFPELATPYIEHVAKPIFEALTRYLTARTELQLADPEATARTFIGTLVYYIIVQRVLHGEALMPMERDRIVENLLTLIVPFDKSEVSDVSRDT